MTTTALKRSNDRKVAADVTASGNVKIANAFGLPSGSNYSCPGATSVCERICYAGKIEKQYKAVTANMVHNWNVLQNKTTEQMTSIIAQMIDDFRADCDKKKGTKSFRIHWDGDFFSRDYAQAWANVIAENDDITFWVYTRSFTDKMFVIDILANLSNLSLYLSVDNDNLNDAKKVRKDYVSVRWAYLGETAESTKAEMLKMNDKPGAICPENVKRIPLITNEGGACIRCDLCVKGKADVRFAISKK